MQGNIIIGSMTVPFSLSDKERLLWLEEWLMATRMGMSSFNICELVFTHEKDIDKSINYLVNNKTGWIITSPQEFIAPMGAIVRFHYDANAEQIINHLRSNDKERTNIHGIREA
jgi:hypothetical protein